jgi:hypothetical protein
MTAKDLTKFALGQAQAINRSGVEVTYSRLERRLEQSSTSQFGGLTEDSSSPEAERRRGELVLSKFCFALHAGILARVPERAFIGVLIAANPLFEP